MNFLENEFSLDILSTMIEIFQLMRKLFTFAVFGPKIEDKKQADSKQ